MIKEMKPLTLAEAKKLVEENEGSEDLKPYFKKYMKLKVKEALEMRKELQALDNHKMKEIDVVKIVDLLPEDASEVNKIFTDLGLEENEIKQVTEIVAKYK
jgi:DNA-directed RNA polymerase subunit F